MVSPKNSEKWRAQIAESSIGWDRQERWWTGVDVGASSAAMFAALCSSRWSLDAKDMGGKSVPHDFDDFGRCKGLLDQFPEWRQDLHRVAEAYPDTAWPQLIARWDEIEKAPPAEQNRIISEIEVDFSKSKC